MYFIPHTLSKCVFQVLFHSACVVLLTCQLRYSPEMTTLITLGSKCQSHKVAGSCIACICQSPLQIDLNDYADGNGNQIHREKH